MRKGRSHGVSLLTLPFQGLLSCKSSLFPGPLSSNSHLFMTTLGAVGITLPMHQMWQRTLGAA